MTYRVTHLTPNTVLADEGTGWTDLHTFTTHESLLQSVIQFSSDNVRVGFVFGGVESIVLDMTELQRGYLLSGTNASAIGTIFTRCYAQPCRWVLTIPDPSGWTGGAGNLVVRAQGYGAGPARKVTRGMLFWRVL